MAKLSIRDLEAQGREVLMRVDFNVPLKDGEITDDTRIVAALPSIKHLLSAGAKLVLCSHLGRPKTAADMQYSLRPAAVRLSELLGQEVGFAEDCIGETTAAARAGLSNGGVILLENTRFHSEEKGNHSDFAKALAGSAELFVNDAFGTAHRAHASTEGVTHHVEKSAMGFLIERELELSTLEQELASFEAEYLRVVGVRYADLDELRARIKEAVTRLARRPARHRDPVAFTGALNSTPPEPAEMPVASRTRSSRISPVSLAPR